MRLLVLSDIHWAGPGEQARAGHETRVVRNPLLRLTAQLWRRWVWLAEPHAHNYRLPAILQQAGTADRVLVNGDFSLDTGFIGVSDSAAFDSSAECLQLLRAHFGNRLLTTIGDHDIGKTSLFGGAGGLRRRSLERCESELGLPRFWMESTRPDWVLIGITSTLAAWPMFASETPPKECAWWQEQHRSHLAQIATAFASVTPDQKIILCCHDPSALAFLYELPEVRARLNQNQVAATIIGHLHSNLVLAAATALAGCPRISRCGVTARRYTTALQRARCWREFRLQLCPSPPGIQLLKDGGWLTLEFETNNSACQVVRHRLGWTQVDRLN